MSVLECTPIHMAQDMMDINFFGTLRLVNAVLPSMKARESGHIIQCGSALGIIGMPFFEIYSATKFAVEGLTESLAPMLRQFNIRYVSHLTLTPLASNFFFFRSRGRNCNYGVEENKKQ